MTTIPIVLDAATLRFMSGWPSTPVCPWRRCWRTALFKLAGSCRSRRCTTQNELISCRNLL